MYRFIALLATAAATAAAAQPPTDCYTGLAYHVASGALAYTAHYRALGKEDPAQQWRVVYRAPDGEVIGRKSLDFSYHPYVPVLTARILGPQVMLGIRRDSDGRWRMVKRRGADGELQTEAFEIRENMAADNGLHPFILAHFERLMAGEAVSFKIAVPARQTVVDMRIRRIDDTSIADARAVRFKASVDMLFVSWFTEDVVLTYDPETRRLVGYRGVSNMQEERGEPYPVRIRYYRGELPKTASDAASCDGRQTPSP